ncbi:MAG TPA: flagellar biosynthesis protein FlhF [Lacipirellulaceae bacterium]|nr:flagellar biosynthesis protein FlhF [Lacipirellulaceae bacterium]
MEIKTFRAKSMPQALALVRSELGPQAMVLHTRELNAGLLGRMFRGREYEIAASPGAQDKNLPNSYPPSSNEAARGGIPDVGLRGDSGPSRSPEMKSPVPSPWGGLGRGPALQNDVAGDLDAQTDVTFGVPSRARLPFPQSAIDHPKSKISPSPALEDFAALVDQLRARTSTPNREVPAALFDVFTDLIEADVDEQIARELIARLRDQPHLDLHDPLAARARLALMLEQELSVTGPIPATRGAGRVVALVGPTGVGKTTTVAKLAANYRLREGRRVGLITVDTYRIAAVEQLRTYADIIDLPMEVVGTPREMREAVQRMRTFDLVLMDTAGRSPRDEVRIQELRSMLAEASPDEVHLVLSAVASARSLSAAAQKFAPVGVTSLLLTKLDEATGLGNLLALTRSSRLPVSYLTDGQNVPDDISVAEAKRLSQLIMNINAR